jgi:hypothetical protein
MEAAMLKIFFYRPVSTVKKTVCVVLSLTMLWAQTGFSDAFSYDPAANSSGVLGTAGQPVGLVSLYGYDKGFAQFGVDGTTGAKTAFTYIDGKKVVSFTCTAQGVVLSNYAYNADGNINFIEDNTTGQKTMYGWVDNGAYWRATEEVNNSGKQVATYTYNDAGVLQEKDEFGVSLADFKQNLPKGAQYNSQTGMVTYSDGTQDKVTTNSDGMVETNEVLYNAQGNPLEQLDFFQQVSGSLISGDSNDSTQVWASANEIVKCLGNYTSDIANNSDGSLTPQNQAPTVVATSAGNALVSQTYTYQWDNTANNGIGGQVLASSTQFSLDSMTLVQHGSESDGCGGQKSKTTTYSAYYMKAEKTSYDSHGKAGDISEQMSDGSWAKIGQYNYRADGTLASIDKTESQTWMADLSGGRQAVSKSMTTVTTFDGLNRVSQVSVTGKEDMVINLNDSSENVQDSDAIQKMTVHINESFQYNYNDSANQVKTNWTDIGGNSHTAVTDPGGLMSVSHTSHTSGDATFDVHVQAGILSGLIPEKQMQMHMDKTTSDVTYYDHGAAQGILQTQNTDKGYTNVDDLDKGWDVVGAVLNVLDMMAQVVSAVCQVVAIILTPTGVGYAAFQAASWISAGVGAACGIASSLFTSGNGNNPNGSTPLEAEQVSNPGYQSISILPPVNPPDDSPLMPFVVNSGRAN